MNVTNMVWLGCPVLQACLVVFLVKQGAQRVFRIFFIYILFAIFLGTTKFLLREHPLPYFYLYWSSELIYAILGIAALYEAYYRLFHHLYDNPRIKFAFPAMALFALACSGSWIWLHGQPPHAIPLLRVIFSLEFSASLLQFGLFALIISLAIYHADSTRRYGYGIAAGFGVAALGTFAGALVFSEFGTKNKNLLNLLSPMAYFVAVLIWLNAFARPEPSGRLAHHREPDPWQLLEQVRQLKKQVKELFGPWLAHFSFRSGSGSP